MLFTSRYRRWTKEERDSLISSITYFSQNHLSIVFKHSVAKVGSEIEHNLVKKAFAADKRIGVYKLKIHVISYIMYVLLAIFVNFSDFHP